MIKPLLTLALVLAAPATAQADVTGAVGGIRDPASGYLELDVRANDRSGAGLRTVRASLGGEPLAEAAIGAPGCVADSADLDAGCPAAGRVPLTLDTTEVADGPQRLEVTAEDGLGAVTHLVDRTVMVANTLPTWTSSVTLHVGSGTPDPNGPPTGPSGDPSASPRACRSPRLSVTLATRPLRFRHGVPVLRKGRSYMFKGRLTCVVDRRRRAAPAGTKLELRQIARGRTVTRRILQIGRNGRLRVRITARSRRAVVFRYRAAGGRLVRVRIPVKVLPRGVAASIAQDPGTEVGGTVPSYLGLGVDAPSEDTLRARVTATSGAVVLSVGGSAAFQPLEPILAAFRAPITNKPVPIPVRETHGRTVEITLSVASP
jgi:hypothetical protein